MKCYKNMELKCCIFKVVCYFMYAGLSFEKNRYFVGEGDGFVEVCGYLYGRQGLTVAVRFSTFFYYDAEGILR